MRGTARIQCRPGDTDFELMPTATVSESDPVTSAPESLTDPPVAAGSSPRGALRPARLRLMAV